MGTVVGGRGVKVRRGVEFWRGVLAVVGYNMGVAGPERVRKERRGSRNGLREGAVMGDKGATGIIAGRPKAERPALCRVPFCLKQRIDTASLPR